MRLWWRTLITMFVRTWINHHFPVSMSRCGMDLNQSRWISIWTCALGICLGTQSRSTSRWFTLGWQEISACYTVWPHFQPLSGTLHIRLYRIFDLHVYLARCPAKNVRTCFTAFQPRSGGWRALRSRLLLSSSSASCPQRYAIFLQGRRKRLGL